MQWKYKGDEMIWEEGELFQQRTFSKEELSDRGYVFDIVKQKPGPFLDMRRIRCGAGWTVYYRQEGMCTLIDRLQRGRKRGELDITLYLTLMYHSLLTLEEADENMIMTGSFQISLETLFCDEKNTKIKIMYVPLAEEAEHVKSRLWSRTSSADILLMLLEETQKLDQGFCFRWPMLGETYLHWKKINAGRNRCIRELRLWLREFPEHEITTGTNHKR